jgi:hypothetical protein
MHDASSNPPGDTHLDTTDTTDTPDAPRAAPSLSALLAFGVPVNTIADTVGVSRMCVYRWASGARAPSVQHLAKLEVMRAQHAAELAARRAPARPLAAVVAAAPAALPLHSFVVRRVQARAKAVGSAQATAELLGRGMALETIAAALASPPPGPFVPRE